MLEKQPIQMDPGQALKTLRIVWVAMLFSLVMYAVVAFIVRNPSTFPPPRTVQISLALMGLMSGLVVLYLRFSRIPDLASSVEPLDKKTLARQLYATHLICYVCSEVTGLLGFVLAFMNGDSKLFVTLFLGAVLLMLVCYPQFPGNE